MTKDLWEAISYLLWYVPDISSVQSKSNELISNILYDDYTFLEIMSYMKLRDEDVLFTDKIDLDIVNFYKNGICTNSQKLIFTKSDNETKAQSMLRHIRNAIAYGSFNIVDDLIIGFDTKSIDKYREAVTGIFKIVLKNLLMALRKINEDLTSRRLVTIALEKCGYEVEEYQEEFQPSTRFDLYAKKKDKRYAIKVKNYDSIDEIDHNFVLDMINNLEGILGSVKPLLVVNTSFLTEKSKSTLRNHDVIILDVKNIKKMLDGRDMVDEKEKPTDLRDKGGYMKVGILGSGNIVKDVLSFLGDIEGIELEAIASTERSYEKCLDFKEKHGIKKAYKNADELLADPDVEVAYVAVPNFLHYDLVKKSLEAGKDVICEKPFTSNRRQLEELIDLARDKNLILLEAISNIHLPNVRKIKEDLEKIGDIKIVSFNYSQYSSRYDAFLRGEIAPVFDVNKDGGALVDLNIYNIHLMVYLFGLPETATYHANIDRGIDTSGIMTFDYKDFKAIDIGSKDSSAPLFSTIQGNKGSIVIQQPNDVSSYELILNKKEPKIINVQDDRHRLYYEFVEFEQIIRNRDFKRVEEKLDHSLKVLSLMEKARLGAGIIYPSDKN